MHAAIQQLQRIETDPDNALPALSFILLQEIQGELARTTDEELQHFDNRGAPLVEKLWQRLLSAMPKPPQGWKYLFFLAAALGLRIGGVRTAADRLAHTAKNLSAMGYKRWPVMAPSQDQTDLFIQEALKRFEAESTPEETSVVHFKYYLSMNFTEMAELMHAPASDLEQLWKVSYQRLGQILEEVVTTSPAEPFPLQPARHKPGQP